MRTQPTTTQPRATPNHLLRVESKSDSDSTITHPIFSNHNSTTRKRIREAAAESSWNLGEYAVSIRSDFRSTASLPPRPQHAADATRRYPTLFRPLQPFASEVETEAGKVALYAVERAPEIRGLVVGVVQDDG